MIANISDYLVLS